MIEGEKKLWNFLDKTMCDERIFVYEQTLIVITHKLNRKKNIYFVTKRKNSNKEGGKNPTWTKLKKMNMT